MLSRNSLVVAGMVSTHRLAVKGPTKGLAESSFEDLLRWLMTTLTSVTSSVDRSGAAQGLAELVGNLGEEKMHKLVQEIIPRTWTSWTSPPGEPTRPSSPPGCSSGIWPSDCISLSPLSAPPATGSSMT